MSITTVWSSLIFFGKVVQYVRLTADVYAIACFCYLIVLVLFDLASTQLSAAHWKRDWETRWKGKDALDSGTIVLLSKLNFISLFHPNNFQACSLIVVQEKRSWFISEDMEHESFSFAFVTSILETFQSSIIEILTNTKALNFTGWLIKS